MKKEQFIEKAKKVHGNKYDYSLLSKNVNTNSKLQIICPNHGIYEQKGQSHLQGSKCPKCAKEQRVKKRRFTKEQFIEKAKKVHGNKYDYSKVNYKSMNDPVIIIWPGYGEFLQSPNSHLQGYISRIDKRHKEYDFISKSKNFFNDKYDYSLVNYDSNKKKVKIICNNCYSSFFVRPDNHLNLHSGCPYCRNSKAQNEINSFIQSLNIETIENTRNLISPYEIDIYLPNYNIGIEYNGLYWHSEKNGLKNKNYHLNKLNLSLKKEIRLITIFEDEWLYKKNIVKNRLKHILGFYDKKIGARKTSISQIENKPGRSFLETHHLQGAGKAKYYFGLFYESELVAVMSFGSLRKALGSSSKEGSYELVRFASSLQVIGGASKLLNFFIKSYFPKEIITYSDKRWNTGNLYKQLGFEYVFDTKPNYWYIVNRQLYHRYTFRKDQQEKKLENFNPELSEWQNMQNHGYDRIWDCGNTKWILKIPSLKEGMKR